MNECQQGTYNKERIDALTEGWTRANQEIMAMRLEQANMIVKP